MTEFYWHIHHGILCEPLRGPIEERIELIKEHKPASEIQTRLKLMRPVQGELPTTLLKAGEAYIKAREAYGRAREDLGAKHAYFKAAHAYDKVLEAYFKARRACRDEIESLHKQECKDCPWDGETIFPKGEE